MMRHLPWLALTGLVWVALPARGEPTEKLGIARRLIDELDFEGALKALSAAERGAENELATVLEIHLLQGVAWATLGKEAKARDAFRKLLVLDSTATLPNDLPPRVLTPFLEAKEWASAYGPLLVTPAVVAGPGDGTGRAVRLVVTKDVLRMARFVRFHLSVGGLSLKVDRPIRDGEASSEVGPQAVTWRAQVLNEHKGALMEVTEAPSLPGVVERQREPAPESKPKPEAKPTQPLVSTSSDWRTPAALTVGGAGVAAAVAGAVLGVGAGQARASLVNATKDGAGRVTSLTQRQAAELEERGRTQAIAATVLFAVSGALVATGVGLLVLRPSETSRVTFAPTLQGVSFVGSF